MFVVLLCSLPLALTALAPALSREDCLCFQGCCDNGWFQYRDACYKPFTNQVTWKDGEENCKKVGAHLASIHSEDENHFIYLLMGRLKDYTKHEAYWIGALSNDKNNNNPDKGSWTDGTQWDFDHFGPGQPDGLQDEYFIGSWKEEAGHITWNDYKNSYQFQYICKKDIS
ncbi:rheacalcin-1-like [Pleurodeles waltl]|uniref:rheacalcin-1-like n=1 Tax=Pleurodeles waltl TaxID=8319 RepID=UPI003709B672